MCESVTAKRRALADSSKPYQCNVRVLLLQNSTGAILVILRELNFVTFRLSNQRFETAVIDSCKTSCSTQAVFHSGWRIHYAIFSAQGCTLKKICQWQRERKPPVPIPNTVVKTFIADNTRRVASREDRSLLTPNLKKPRIFNSEVFYYIILLFCRVKTRPVDWLLNSLVEGCPIFNMLR